MEKKSATLAAMANEQLEQRGLGTDDISLLLTPEDDLAKQDNPTKAGSNRRNRSVRITNENGKFKQLSFWVSKEEYFALREANLVRELAGDEPYRHEHMIRFAFRAYLQDLGFLRSGTE